MITLFSGNKNMKKKKQTNFEKLLTAFLSDKDVSSRKAFHFDLLIVALILVSSVIFVAETYSLPPVISLILHFIDISIILLFTVEYFARIYVARDKTDYIFSWYGFIDFIAFAPFWVSFFIPWIHSFQFLRVFRVFKLFRFFNEYLGDSTVREKEATRILLAKVFFVIFVLLFVSSALIFTLEAPVNPKINTFDDATYFAVVTITTVGFGDITPVTRAGRIAIAFMIMFGIILIPVYVASLLRTYLIYSSKRRVVCTNCGFSLHDPNALYCKMCGAKIYHEHEEDF